MLWSRLWHSSLFRLLLGVTFLILIWLLLSRSFNVNELVQTLSAFPLGAFTSLLVLSASINFLKGWRFHILVRHVGMKLGFWESLKIFFASQAATPLPAGETIRAAMLRQRTNTSLSLSAAPVLGQAVYEIAAAVAVMFLASLYYRELLVPSLTVIAFLTAVMVILLYSPMFDMLLRLFKRFKFVRTHADRFKGARHNLKQNFELLERGGFDRHVIKAITLACLAQAVGGVLIFMAAKVFELDLNFFQATLVYASGAILQGLFSVIPGGLGVTEGGMSGVLHILGVDFSTALAMVIVVRLTTLVFPVIVGFIFLSVFFARRTLFRRS